MLTLLLFKGPMGIGKSTLARALGKTLSWPVVDKDDASDVLLVQVENYGPLAYGVMFKQAESLLAQGFNVIVDSPLRGREGLEHAVTLAAQVPAQIKVLDCSCSNQHQWRERLEQRQKRPAHILKTWPDFARYWQVAEADFNYDISEPRLEIDTTLALDENVERIKHWLKA